jgi:oligosaccharyl transferase (archaeosortase A-associated)
MSDDSSLDSLKARLSDVREWYQYPAVGILFVFMLWVRLRSMDRFYVNGEVLFTGNDAWYHLRQIEYIVANWPQTMPFDPWTHFPYGTSVGQFGTVFDQLIATAALIVGLGSPSEQLIREALLVAPAVFGALCIIPTYLIGRRLGGRAGGVFAALIVAILPGQFLFRGLVGFSDHNIAEPFFQSFGVLALMIALTAAERNPVIWEQVTDRDFSGMRSTLLWSVVAGTAIALYIWMWPPGVLLVGIAGVYFAIKLAVDYLAGRSPDHIATVAVVSMGTTAILVALPFSRMSFSSSQFSLVQPVVALSVAIGAIFMAWLARQWDANDLDPSLYPVTIAGIGILGALGTWIALPNVFNYFQRNVVRIVGFNTGAATRTIQEAQPFLQGQGFFNAVFGYYGLAFFSALVGLGILAYRTYDGEHSAEYLFVIVWALFITAAAFTQVRFNYYLAIPVAVLNAPIAAAVLDRDLSGFGLAGVERLRDIEGTHVMTIALVLIVVVAPLAIGVGSGSGSGPSIRPAYQVGNSTGPSGGYLAWQGPLQWMSENTPAEGDWNGSGNTDLMDYYGTYAQTEDYDYPAGAYGVMSWWDYGHWITVTGERIPNANPFQQGATEAANFLLSQSEGSATDVLETVSEDDAETRYVVLDHQMAIPSGRSKFAAPITFQTLDSSWDLSTFYNGFYVYGGQQQGYSFAGFLKNDAYWNSTMVRLYRFHGSAVEPSTTVYRWADQGQFLRGSSLVVKLGPQTGNATQSFQNVSAAREFVRNNPRAQVGGLRAPGKYVEALEHFRLVKASSAPAPQSVLFRELLQDPIRNNWPFTKVFERVPGATVQVEGPPNTLITASVSMNMTTVGRSFTYTQRARTGDDGVATFTLPYSTTGYAQWGPENGHTNVAVRADGQYTFTTSDLSGPGDDTLVVYNATADISEGAVIGEAAGPGTIELTREEVDTGGGNESNTSAYAPLPLSLESGSEDHEEGASLSVHGPSLQAPVTRTLA